MKYKPQHVRVGMTLGKLVTIWPIVDDCIEGNAEEGDYTELYPDFAAECILRLYSESKHAEYLGLLPDGFSSTEYFKSIIPPHILVEFEETT